MNEIEAILSKYESLLNEIEAVLSKYESLLNEIEAILSKYESLLSRIPCWEDGSTVKRVELLCEWVKKSIQVEDTFCLQSQPRKDEIIALVNSWFRRRPTTKWSAKEMKALKAVLDLQPMDEELRILDRYYSAEIPEKENYRRRDVLTLLNNWRGEVDRAVMWKPAKSAAQLMGVKL